MRIVLALGIGLVACREGGDPKLGSAFVDRFDRSEIGADYNDTSGKYRIENGQLCVEEARNHPLWLKRRLPDDVHVSFRARSESPEGDIKAEVFGDGRSHATESSYTATSYVLVFGGWRNTVSVLARMDEHGSDRKSRRDPRVVPGRFYRFDIRREGSRLRWQLDGEPFLELDDPYPLRGPGHDHFAFNDWDAPLCFDDLELRPL